MGLENDETMEEIVVMVAYKNAISDALFAIVCNANANHVDLAWLPKKIIEHVQKLIDNTDLLLSPLSDSEEATLDGKPFPNQYVMDSVHYWVTTHTDRIHVIEKLLIHFLESTLPAWRRFTREYDEDADINSLTPEEKLELCIPPQMTQMSQFLAHCEAIPDSVAAPCTISMLKQLIIGITLKHLLPQNWTPRRMLSTSCGWPVLKMQVVG
jgi:hypothetical protein